MILNIILTPHTYDGVRKVKLETVGYFPWFKGPKEISIENIIFNYIDIDELYNYGRPKTYQISKETLIQV